MTSSGWMDEGVCVEIGGEVFFDLSNGDKSSARMAKRACAMCPVRDECLDWVLSLTDGYGDYLPTDGVFGGTTKTERARIIAARNAEAA